MWSCIWRLEAVLRSGVERGQPVLQRWPRSVRAEGMTRGLTLGPAALAAGHTVTGETALALS
jgi:hypothetical protein